VLEPVIARYRTTMKRRYLGRKAHPRKNAR
jgi:hypothetical protein